VREAKDLQQEVEDLEQAMRGSIERIWTEREKSQSDDNDGMLLAGVGSSQPRLVDKVPKPSITDVPWKVGWIKTVRLAVR
jgi:hypothetical protein